MSLVRVPLSEVRSVVKIPLLVGGLPDVLQLSEIEQPVPDVDQILIQVCAASVNPYDWHMMTGKPYLARTAAGLPRPKNPVLGADAAGRVVAVGRDVTCRSRP